jgi:hypothetical protein
MEKIMGDILEEANAVLQCKTCPWYKNCVTPMRLTPDDLQKQMMAMMGQPGAAQGGNDDMRRFVEATSASLQNVILEGCPVFINRLRSNPRLAQLIKQKMQEWGGDIEDPGRR